ncbi:50S ribosomal protein L4 [archaeon]|nr:50S ribosomal protein L4 [archaeon]MBL7056702.1 50S ribosomal protein L4 [Candidatus Woesearchaeota archaeon]
MKLKTLNLNKTETGAVELPAQFFEPVRTDLIHRAFLVIQFNKTQPYGTNPRAGLRASADLSRRRRKYRGSYGLGISRVPRKILSRRGTRMNWVGAVMPGTVGGRRAHPPKAEKIWAKKINQDERRKAIRSAIAATLNTDLVKKRGHLAPSNYPFIIDDNFTEVKKTAELIKILEHIGFKDEMDRSRSRGSKGLLLVSTTKALDKSCANIPGVETEVVSSLNVELLAPGGVPGRLTVFTKSAIEELSKKKLFTNAIVKEEKIVKEKKVTVKKKAKPIPKKETKPKSKSQTKKK